MKPPGPVQEDPVAIARCDGAAEAELVRSLLESCGIPCHIGSGIRALPVIVPDLGEVWVSVPATLAEEATAILRASPLIVPRPGRGPWLRVIEGGRSPRARLDKPSDGSDTDGESGKA